MEGEENAMANPDSDNAPPLTPTPPIVITLFATTAVNLVIFPQSALMPNLKLWNQRNESPSPIHPPQMKKPAMNMYAQLV